MIQYNGESFAAAISLANNLCREAQSAASSATAILNGINPPEGLNISGMIASMISEINRLAARAQEVIGIISSIGTAIEGYDANLAKQINSELEKHNQTVQLKNKTMLGVYGAEWNSLENNAAIKMQLKKGVDSYQNSLEYVLNKYNGNIDQSLKDKSLSEIAPADVGNDWTPLAAENSLKKGIINEDDMLAIKLLYINEGAKAANRYLQYRLDDAEYNKGLELTKELKNNPSAYKYIVSMLSGAANSIGGMVTSASKLTGTYDDSLEYFNSKTGSAGAYGIATNALMEKSTGFDKVLLQVSNGIGYMLPSIAASLSLNAIGGGVGIGTTGAAMTSSELSALDALLLTDAAKIASNATMALASAGNKYYEAKSQGHTESAASKAALLIGGEELATQLLFNGVNSLGEAFIPAKIKSIVADIKPSIGNNYFFNQAIDIGSEFFEEGFQNAIYEPIVNSIVLKEQQDWSINDVTKNFVQSGLIGGLTAGIMNTGTSAFSTAYNTANKVVQNINTNNNFQINNVLNYMESLGKAIGTEIFDTNSYIIPKSISDFINFLGGSGKINTTIDSAIKIMDEKFGVGEGVKRLNELVDTGDIRVITRDNGMRDAISKLNIDDITYYLHENKLRTNIFDSISELSNQKQDLIDRYNKISKLMPKNIQNQIFNSFVNLENNIKNMNLSLARSQIQETSLKIDEYINSQQYTSKMVNEIENNQSLSIDKISEENTHTLKYDVLSNIPKNLSEFEAMRAIYIELAKRVSYQDRYFANQSSINYAAQKYIDINTNSNINGVKEVICYGWARLYKQLLEEYGIDSSRIKLCGADADGAHKWISVDLENGLYLFADATNAYYNSIEESSGTDLGKIKSGDRTSGFCITDKEFLFKWPSEEELNSYNKGTDNLLMNIDHKIGYNIDGKYQPELYYKFAKQFDDENFLSSFFKNEKQEFEEKSNIFLNVPKDRMSVLESYTAMKNYKKIIFNEKQANNIENMFFYVNKKTNETHYENTIYQLVTIKNANNTKFYLKTGMDDSLHEIGFDDVIEMIHNKTITFKSDDPDYQIVHNYNNFMKLKELEIDFDI